ncbi:MAG TPA: RNA polymerase sigma factor RpoD/SigA [Mucilaginibacter sp.]|jgi:RNA polymerase primary sigma factor|nr:RNA polymerase sigma factor RpoD/SigA [Mucilaginibacter sp.]
MRQLKISQSITNRDSQSLDKYLNDISKIPMITPDEEVTLTRLIRAGDQAALDKLARANLRFVVSVSKKFQNQGLTLNDLISEGNLGLIKAAKRFDETKGFKFISYAVWWIRQAIMQAIAEQSRMVRLPLNQVGSLTRLHKTFARLEQEYQRDPSLEELADAMEKSADAVADVISKSGRHLSVDAPFVSGEENSLLDVLITPGAETDDVLMKESLAYAIRHSLAVLTLREREIITLFYGIGSVDAKSLDEISVHYGLTRERVRQLKDKALMQLRRHNVSQNLMGYLGE